MKPKYFPGNVDGSSVQTHSLYPGVVTRYVRIQPWAWEGQIAIRLELIGVGPIAVWDDVMKSNCSFDIDLCGWQQALDDDSDWLHQGSRVPSHDSYPAHDHMNSYGAYVVMTSNPSINQTAKLQSPPIKSRESSNSSCLRFWTYMNGGSVGNLRVYVSNNKTVVTSEHLVFARSGNQGDRWISAEVECIMPHDAPFYITFEGRLKSWDIGSIALDDVTITPGNCPARIRSIECDYDVTDCGWYQDDSDDTDWMFISGSPPTSSKMPQHDHSMSRDGRYLYILGSGNDEFHEARIASPVITIDDSPDKICFSFWYYALSDGTSELSVEFVEDGPVTNVALTEKITIVYNNERVWRQSRITVYYPPPTPFYMVIVGKVKGHHILAIDDSTLYYGQCLDDPSSLPQSGYIDGYQTLPASCAVWKRRGQTSDGHYTIDPDGPGNGVHPFRVYCDMTTDEHTGIMVFNHNLNPESEITDYELPYSYPFIVTYERASLTQIAAAADISGECTQFIKLGCTEVALTGYTAWYDRHGDQMNYWGGAPENSSSCACGSKGSCIISSLPCNCDGKLKFVPLEDSGNITQKSSLPVSEIRVGDTGGSFEKADVTLGPLYCKGEDPQSIVMDQFEFTILTNTRTPGLFIAELVTASAQLCAEACIAQDSCQSLSYNKDNGTCILKERGDPMTSRIRDAAWNEYLRIWPADDRSVNCDFGKDGCSWIQDSSDDADWIVSDGNQGNVRRTGPLRDHRDTSGRHYSGIRSVRLVDGPTPREGRVEIFYKGQWASVCGITLSLPQGNILCQSLGFGDARHVTANASYVQGSGEMVVDLQCNGDEDDIRECPMRDIGHTACPHTDEAGVVCSPGVRLTGGVTPREGTVELLYNESWGSICHTNWDIDDANVICRGLGYDRALNAVGSAFYTEGSGEILIDDVSCTGSEESVFDCGHSPIGETACDHDEDAGVVCSYEDDSELYRLKGSYLYIDSSEQLSTANITRLQSPIIQIPVAEGALCFRFWYYMFGEDAQSLRVYVNDVEDGVASGEIAFEVSGNHGEQWIMDQFDIVGNDTAPFTVTIEAVTGVGVNGDIAIDDIEVLAGSCPYEPMSCDFEETFICGFIQDEEDNADWRRGKGDVIQDDEKPPYDNTFHDIHEYVYVI
nr:MAM and LDL-receptor class A domain-containing protein 1-like [Lytechinus pictus]